VFHLGAHSSFLWFYLLHTDGQVECDDPSDIDTCHGFLLAVYANDLSGNKAQFFRRYQREHQVPVTILSNQDLEGSEFLKHAHSQLMDFHLYHNTIAPAANYSGFEASQVLSTAQPPEFAILSTWNEAIPWAGGAWHAWTDIDSMDLAQQPFVQDQIYVVNEAYSLMQGWAEGSIKLADEILQDHFDVARPWDFELIDLNQIVRQTNSQECTATSGSGTSSGGAGAATGGGGGGNAALLCFTGEALVELADGSVKELADIEVGDELSTGVVTQVLIHPVGKEVPVAVLSTVHGELVGTPDHPVYYNGVWMEFASLPSHHDENHGLQVQVRHVDAFYNLEVDGHLVLTHEDDEVDVTLLEEEEDVEEKSTRHSYVVNGIRASGLGDNVALNLLYPRQKEWKERSEAARKQMEAASPNASGAA
jgi:hypothetical protein